MITYLDTASLETYTAAVASRAGVRVQWDEPNTVPRTNGSVIYLPKLTSTATQDDVTSLRYALKHEVSHITYTDFAYFAEQKPQGLLQFIVNLLEDNRIDYLNDHAWKGDKALANEYARVFASKLTTEKKIAVDVEKVASLFAWESDYRDWTPNAAAMSSAMKKMGLISKDNQAKYKKLSEGDYGKRLEDLRAKGDGPSILSLAKDILRDVFGEDPAKYMGKNPTKGKGSKGDKESSGEEAEEGKASGSDMEDRLITVEELTKHMGEHVISRTGINCTTKMGGKAYTIPTKDEYRVGRFPLSAEEGERVVGSKLRDVGYAYEAKKVRAHIASESRPMANKLRIALQVRSQGRWEGCKKRGSLHGGGIHALITAKGTKREEKVFKQHVTSNTLDTAVCLLVDCSGSMSGEKFETATAAAASVSGALRPLHIEHQVLGFTNHCATEDPVIWVFKDWGHPINDEELVERFATTSCALFNNSDGDAIVWATHSLLQRKEKRKLLIVLSDGAPAGRDHMGDVTTYTKQVVKHIEEHSPIEIYGVGIMSTDVKRFYKNNTVVNDLSSLSPSILSILDKHI